MMEEEEALFFMCECHYQLVCVCGQASAEIISRRSTSEESPGEQLLRLGAAANRPPTRPLAPERREVGTLEDDEEDDHDVESDFNVWLECALGKDASTQTGTAVALHPPFRPEPPACASVNQPTRRGSLEGKQAEIAMASLREQLRAKEKDMEFINSQNQALPCACCVLRWVFTAAALELFILL